MEGRAWNDTVMEHENGENHEKNNNMQRGEKQITIHTMNTDLLARKNNKNGGKSQLLGDLSATATQYRHDIWNTRQYPSSKRPRTKTTEYYVNIALCSATLLPKYIVTFVKILKKENPSFLFASKPLVLTFVASSQTHTMGSQYLTHSV